MSFKSAWLPAPPLLHKPSVHSISCTNPLLHAIRSTNPLLHAIRSTNPLLHTSRSTNPGQQQLLALEVEINKRTRLLHKLHEGAAKVAELLEGRSSGGGGGDTGGYDAVSHLQHCMRSGASELMALVQVRTQL